VTSDFVIEYEYPGTVNGQPVGRIYVDGPLFGSDDIFSYVQDRARASGWPSREAAEAEAGRRYWPKWRVEPR